MTLAQLAREIREMIVAVLDDPENERELYELQQIVSLDDAAIVQWWLCCPFCHQPLISWTATEVLMAISDGQAQFDALTDTMAAFHHGEEVGDPDCIQTWEAQHPEERESGRSTFARGGVPHPHKPS